MDEPPLLALLFAFQSFNSVTVLPDPSDQSWPILATSKDFKGREAVPERIDLDDTSGARLKSQVPKRSVVLK